MAPGPGHGRAARSRRPRRSPCRPRCLALQPAGAWSAPVDRAPPVPCRLRLTPPSGALLSHCRVIALLVPLADHDKPPRLAHVAARRTLTVYAPLAPALPRVHRRKVARPMDRLATGAPAPPPCPAHVAPPAARGRLAAASSAARFHATAVSGLQPGGTCAARRS